MIQGTWALDRDATLQANSFFPEKFRNELRQGLEENPFELTITNGVYASTGRRKTIEDRYEVLSVQGNTVTIRLSPPDGGSYGLGSKKRLVLKSGKLAIDGPDGLTVIMKRSPDRASADPSNDDSPKP